MTTRRRVLLVAHAIHPEETSGVPLACATLARGLLERGHEVAVLTPAPIAPGAAPALEVGREPGGLLRLRMRSWRAPSALGVVTTGWDGAGAGRPGDAELLAALRRVLARFAPGVAHVLDLVGLPPRVVDAIWAIRVPILRTVSSFEDLCGNIAPAYGCDTARGEPCAPPYAPRRCARFVAELRATMRTGRAWALEEPLEVSALETERFAAALTAKRARAVVEFRERYAAVVFPSEGARRSFEEAIPLDGRRVAVVPPGVVRPSPAEGSDLGGGLGARPLRVAWIGVGEHNKGADLVVAAWRDPRLAAASDVELVTAGHGEREPLRLLATHCPNVIELGPLSPDARDQLVASASLGLVTSRFETYHRVTREFLAAGVPVVTTPALGVLDVVRHGENGWLASGFSAQEVAEALVGCVRDPARLERLRQGARATNVPTPTDELDAYESIYEELEEP
jgi:glycosyltransferase involved in cell wall biosynthesis